MIIRVDLPNNPETEAMARDFIMILNELYHYPGAFIDPFPWVACKVVPLPGFRKSKFEDRPGRPRRIVTLEPIDHAKTNDVAIYRSPEIIDLKTWLSVHGPRAGIR